MSHSILGKYKVEIDVADLANGDSIAAYLVSASGALITSASINGNESVRVVAASEFAEDSAHVSGDRGSFMLAVRNDVEGSLVGTDGDYAPLQVDALGRLRVNADLNVNNDFVYAEDSAHVSGDLGAFMLAVRNDAGISLVDTDGDYAPLSLDANGALRIVGSIVVDGSFAEDSAHTSGDVGLHTLSVRKDTLSSNVSADGDYASNIQWSEGSLKVVDLPNIGIVSAAVAVDNTVGGTSLGAPVANRRNIMIQNRGSRSIFIGPSGVTLASGVEIPRGADMTLNLGPAVTIFAISDSATASDVRVMQLS